MLGEICGAAGSGKTQFALSLAAECVLQQHLMQQQQQSLLANRASSFNSSSNAMGVVRKHQETENAKRCKLSDGQNHQQPHGWPIATEATASTGPPTELRAALGELWGSCLHYRLFLSRVSTHCTTEEAADMTDAPQRQQTYRPFGSMRYMHLLFAPHLAPSSTPFAVTEAGVIDV
ncbi:DNA repair protein reca [Cyclospora cayetanensis]|uniref:DNA repair protein reca n=1 Tax=Cyclospora cayetanensis TaxID=88456 RepID=A0A1D3CTL6_9EIME|nr:DNA repair protein reca [Cyclospora cayetanensis]